MTGFVLSRRQVWLLVFVTLFWGVNWPIMKSAVGAYPAMAFRAWSMVLGLPCLWVGLKLLRVPLQVPRRYWGELLLLATTNMVAWHLCLMWALPGLSSGRAAIIGYTMPVFSALWGMLLYRQRLSRPQWLGVGSATAGVVLLLWHEFSRLSGVPLAGLTLLAGTAVWALGTQQLRRSNWLTCSHGQSRIANALARYGYKTHSSFVRQRWRRASECRRGYCVGFTHRLWQRRPNLSGRWVAQCPVPG